MSQTRLLSFCINSGNWGFSGRIKGRFFDSTKKMVCLIDTDAQCPTLGVDSGGNKDILKIRRLNEQENGEIVLVDVDSPTRKETKIEDILNPQQFYEALKATIDQYGTSEDKEAFASFDFDETATHSRIKGDDSILKQNTLDRNIREDKQRIIDFVDAHKDVIANIYTSTPYVNTPLGWVNKLNALFN